MRPVLFLRPPGFGHVHGGPDELDEIAGDAEHGMADGVDAPDRSVRKHHAVIQLVVDPLPDRVLDDLGGPCPVLRMNAPIKVVR